MDSLERRVRSGPDRLGLIQPNRVACIVPAWNEGARIASVVRGVPKSAVGAIFVVDDGSTDDTAAAAEAEGARVLRQTRNRGVGAAIRAGMIAAKTMGFEAAIMISGAGKSPPDQIPQLLAVLDNGVDLVQGSRYVQGGSQMRMPLGRVFGTLAYSWLFSLLSGHRVHDASSGFRAVRLSMLDDPRIRLDQEWLDHYELEPYLLFKALSCGFRVVEVPMRVEYPPAGNSYTKMRAIIGWWSIFRPVLFLALRIRS